MSNFYWRGGVGSFYNAGNWAAYAPLTMDKSGFGVAIVAPGGGDTAEAYLGGGFVGGATAAQINIDATFSLSGTFNIGSYLIFGGVAAAAVTISGAFRNTAYLAVGNYQPGSMSIGAGAVAVNDGEIGVGQFAKSAGSVSISAGGTLTGNSNMLIGNDVGGVGQVSVANKASALSVAGYLVVGNAGTGTLTVDDKADVAVGGSLLVGAAATGGPSGTLTVKNGATVEVNGDYFMLGNLAGSIGQVAVANKASKVSVAKQLVIGNAGTGSLLVDDTADLTVAGDLFVGGAGTSATQGTLTVQKGATVEAGSNLVVGSLAGVVGQAAVKNRTSSLTVAKQLLLGKEGTGSLLIDDYADVNVKGELIVAGSGGSGSAGTLTVQNGATLETAGTGAYIGGFGSQATSGSATASVTGAGTKWVATSKIQVQTNGSLNVAQGAIVQTNAYMVMYSSSKLSFDVASSVEVGTAGGAAAGFLTVDKAGAVYGAGTIGGSVIDNGTIDAQNGTLRITGAVSGSGVLMAEKGGTLRIDGGLTAPASLQFGDATGSIVLGGSAVPLLTVTGFVQGDVIDLAGIVAGGAYYDTTTKHLRLTQTSSRSSATVAELVLTGDYSKLGFGLAPDGSTGTALSVQKLKPLWTSSANNVDFNALTDEQDQNLRPSTDLYHALEGDDVITLPDDAHAAKMASGMPFVLYDRNTTFHAGAGADTFDFTPDQGLNGYTPGKTIFIDGDSPSPSANLARPYSTPTLVDRIVLPGSADKYSFAVDYRTDPARPHTIIFANAVSASPLQIDTVGIEQAVFADATMHNVVRLDRSSLYAEAARLSAEVYGPQSAKHGNETLASDPKPVIAQTTAIGNGAVSRGWHEMSGLELGLLPASLGQFGSLSYSFTNGFYQGIGPTGLPVPYPTTEGNALVLSGLVNDKPTISVTFRGTDQWSDFDDYASFSTAYAKFEPLIGALKTYIAAHPDYQVIVAGHSLGAAMAQLLGNELPNAQVITFGSPGAEKPSGASQVNFFHSADPVATFVPLISQNNTVAGLAARLSLSTLLSTTPLGPYGAAALIAAIQPKNRSGSDVDVSSLIGIGSGFGQHDLGLDNVTNQTQPGYLRDLEKLVDFAKDTASPFSRTDLGKSLLTNTPIGNNPPQISLGNSSDLGGLVKVNSSDDFVLGDIGKSNDFLWKNYVSRDTPVFIDGGAHSSDALNLLVLNFDDLSFRAVQVGDHYQLFDDAVSTTKPIAVLYRVDWVVPAGRGKAIPLSGRPLPTQTAQAGQTVLTVDGQSRMTYALDGVSEVNGTAPGAVVVYGADTKVVRVTGAGSTVVADGKSAAGPIVIDTGLGAVTVFDDARDAQFVGHLAGASLDGGGGANTIRYAGQSAAYRIGWNADGSVAITDADGLGSDSLRNIQSATFADCTVSLVLADYVATAQLFDVAFYLAQNPDVKAAGVDPLQHYLASGYREGRDPNALFSTGYYLKANPDVAAAGLNPLMHFAVSGWKEGRNPSSSFDVRDYLAANSDVQAAGLNPLLHYVQSGKAEGRAAFAVSAVPKDPLLDAAYYYANNPDVKAAGVDATAHYLASGYKEGRNPNALFDSRYYLTQNPDVKAAGVNPLQHFEASGWKEGRQPSLMFDDAKYLAANPDVKAAGIDPLAHYLINGQYEGRQTFLTGGSAAADPLVNAAYYDAQLGATLIPSGTAGQQQAAWSYDATGWQKGLNPDAFFDTNYYLSHNPDVAAAHINPLIHFEISGWHEGRDPSAAFSTNKYLGAYADVKAANLDPLLHYVNNGQGEGRTAFAA